MVNVGQIQIVEFLAKRVLICIRTQKGHLLPLESPPQEERNENCWRTSCSTKKSSIILR